MPPRLVRTDAPPKSSTTVKRLKPTKTAQLAPESPANVFAAHGHAANARPREGWAFLTRDAINAAVKSSVEQGIVRFKSAKFRGKSGLEDIHDQLIDDVYKSTQHLWSVNASPQLNVRTIRMLKRQFNHAMTKWRICNDERYKELYKRMVDRHSTLVNAPVTIDLELVPQAMAHASADGFFLPAPSVPVAGDICLTPASLLAVGQSNTTSPALETRVCWLTAALEIDHAYSCLVRLTDEVSLEVLKAAVREAARLPLFRRDEDIILCAFIPPAEMQLTCIDDLSSTGNYYRAPRTPTQHHLPALFVLPPADAETIKDLISRATQVVAPKLFNCRMSQFFSTPASEIPAPGNDSDVTVIGEDDATLYNYDSRACGDDDIIRSNHTLDGEDDATLYGNDTLDGEDDTTSFGMMTPDTEDDTPTCSNDDLVEWEPVGEPEHYVMVSMSDAASHTSGMDSGCRVEGSNYDPQVTCDAAQPEVHGPLPSSEHEPMYPWSPHDIPAVPVDYSSDEDMPLATSDWFRSSHSDSRYHNIARHTDAV